MEALEELAVSYERQDGEMEASNEEKAVLQCEIEKLQVGLQVTLILHFYTGYHSFSILHSTICPFSFPQFSIYYYSPFHIFILHSISFSILQYELQERTQQFLAIQEVGDLRQRTATDLVQTLVEKIVDISEVFEENSHSKLPAVSIAI